MGRTEQTLSYSLVCVARIKYPLKMNSELQKLVTDNASLFIQQRKELTEILIDWETTNKYVILNESKAQLGFITERAGGFGKILRRFFLRSHRPLEIDVMSTTGEILLHLSRPFFWFFSDLNVSSPEGERYGSVHRRFGIIRKIYDLRDASGQTFARIESPFWRLWTFPVIGTTAVISKRWAGALREIFTDADTYMISYGQEDWTFAQRTVLLTAAISIDFDFFENNQGAGGGIFGLFE